ncbi:MAG TPA: response regulator [Nitrospirota bacterium]|nr:response regulator [Nitrospirota bacterium]
MAKERILIVDDEQDVVDLLRYNLEKADYETVVALNGHQAIEAVRLDAPDVVLLDIMLPDISGWEICKTLRDSSLGKFLPIIMLTALSDEEARIKGLTLGANDYLAKPFSLRELQLKIRKCLDQRQTIKSFIAKEQDHDTSLRYLVHELKNSLSVIGNFSALALRKGKDTKKYLQTINSASAHAENLLNDTSLLARLEQEGSAFPITPVDISAVCEEVVDMFRDEAKKNEIEIEIINKTRFLVRGDRTAVRQVLVNLVSNAVKYNRRGGKVRLSFNDAGSCLQISVQDEGCGVSSEELPRIFDKFYRAGGSERKKGAGLGLYIVKLMALAMGGKITASSTIGAGSTFTVTFKRCGAEGCEQGNAVRDEAVQTATTHE